MRLLMEALGDEADVAIFTDLLGEVYECLPTDQFVTHLDRINKDARITSLNFDGLDSLTDEAFIALNDKLRSWGDGNKLQEVVAKVSCVGCVHLTDWGIYNLVSALPKLEEVVLDGCTLLTERSLYYIKTFCAEVRNIRMIATNVSYMLEFPETVHLVLDGCPIVHQHQALPENSALPCYKLVMFSKFKAMPRLSDVLFGAKSKKDSPAMSMGPKNAMEYHKCAKLPLANPDFVLNAMELHCRTTMLAPFLSEKAAYILTVDMDDLQDNNLENPVLHIMMRLNSVRGQVKQSPIMILAMHKTDSKAGQIGAILEELSGQLQQALTLQIETVRDHVTLEAYDSSRAHTRDFQTQQRYARSRLVQHYSNTYSMYSMDVNTLQVKKYWPQSGGSVAELTQEVATLRETLEAVLSMQAPHMEAAVLSLQGLNKSDLSEMKSFSSPPHLLVRCLEAVCILLGIRLPSPDKTEDAGVRRGSWGIIKKELLFDSRVIYKLIDFDKESITEKQLIALKDYIDDPELNPQRLKAMSRSGNAFWLWVKAMYVFGTECLPTYRLYRAAEAKLQAKTQDQPAADQSQTTAEGPSIILEAVEAACRTLDTMYPEHDARQLGCSPLLQSVETCCGKLGPGIYPLSHIHAELSGAGGEGADLRKTGKALEKLHQMGKILYYPDAPSSPVIPDIQWFMRLLTALENTKVDDETKNGTRYKAVAPFMALFNPQHFCKMWPRQAKEQQVEKVTELLRFIGILLPVPRRSYDSETDDDVAADAAENQPLLTRFTYLNEKVFIRDELDSGNMGSVDFRHNFWPDFRTEFYNEHDVQVQMDYRFTMGMPPGLVPAIMSEFIQMGSVTFITRWSALVRVGAAEIYIKHNVHGTLVSSSIDVQARVTSLGMETECSKLQQYLWSALSPYLLAIEYHVNKYRHLHVRFRIPCQGTCDSSLPQTFSPVDFVHELGARVKCDRCSGEGMPTENMPYLTGRKWEPPFHDFMEREMRRADDNLVNPYNWQYRGQKLSWVCRHCGIFKGAAIRLWRMQTCLYPTFIRHGFKQHCGEKTDDEAKEDTRKCSSVVQGMTGEAGSVKKTLVTCKQAPYLGGLMDINITVVSAGHISVILCNAHGLHEKNITVADLDKACLTYNLKTGQHVCQSHITDDEEEKHPAESRQLETLSAGDTLSVRFHNITTVVTTAAEETVGLEMSLEKNGRSLRTDIVPFKVVLGLVLETEGDMCPKVVLAAPTAVVIHASHFTLGSALLYKSGHGNQYSLGRVLAIRGHDLLVGTPGEPNEQRQLPSDSDDLFPAGTYSVNISIVIGKEPMKKSSQMIKYLEDNQCWTAPLGLFGYNKTLNQSAFSSIHAHALEPYLCAVNVNSPQALETGFLYTTASNYTQRFKTKTTSIFLPRDLSMMTLMNPSRMPVHNWQKQTLHFVCRGFESNRGDNFAGRDLHFVDSSPVNVPFEKVSEVYSHLVEDLLLCYQSMSKHQSILASWSETFAQISEDVPLAEMLEGVHTLLDLYRSTFILATRLQESLVDKYKPKKVSFKTTTSYLDTLCRDNFPPLAKDRQHRCETHASLSRKSGTKHLVEGLPYGHCISYISFSHVNLEKLFTSIFTLLPNLQGVKLYKNHLQSLEGVGRAKQLQCLIVAGNEIKQLPPELVNLKDKLWMLVIRDNPITELPDFILQLTKLRHLDLGNTLITKLPENIGELSHLKTLDMKYTMVNQLPESFSKLQGLETLVLTGVPWLQEPDRYPNGLSAEHFSEWCNSEPRAISSLSEEERTQMFTDCDVNKSGNLTGDEIRALTVKLQKRFPHFGQDVPEDEEYGGIPKQIFSLRNLRVLHLNYQCLHHVPDAIGRLRRLQMFFLSSNHHLETISGNVAKGHLKVLGVESCPQLRTPPQEIIAQGMKVTIAYLQRLSQGSKACSRTKLMFVGLGGAGKTSLMRALMSGDFKTGSTHSEGITDGIDISTWSIRRGEMSLQFSVWDFAGQTVYYNTHQFFLSTRAVYILVWNTRLGFEHSGLEFWLSSIACHCPKAPIFIVGTHADQITNPELPEDSLCKRYSNIAGFFTVSSMTGQGVKLMSETLINVTLQQPYMGEMIPECWLRFEKYILGQRNEQSLMPWKQLLQLAQKSAIYGAEIRQAVKFLHELGTLQHFDNEVLRDRVVINPQWIVDVMACVVSVHNKEVKDGHLHHKDIEVLWKDYPKDLHKWLLRLTEVFDLTFPMEDLPQNVVPCLLPTKEPEYTWPSSGDEGGGRETKMLYRFDYLPAGLFNRVQVRLHQYSDGATLWKVGSVLRKNGHMALVQQIGDNEVLVKAFGQRPENIILLVHEVFEALISEFFQGVKYEYQVPCTDCLKMETRDPTMFSSKVLRRAIEMKALFLQCHTFFHTLSMRDIQSVMPPQSSSDYSMQLQSTMAQLDELHDDLAIDVFLLYCEADVPPEGSTVQAVHPRQLKDDLEKNGFTCWYCEDLSEKAATDLTQAMSNSKIVLLLMSENFAKDSHCQAMFYHAKDKLHKQMMMTVVGEGMGWRETEVGARVGHWLYVNFQRYPQYASKLEEVVGRLQQKLDIKKSVKSVENDVFLSYCWTNSAKALEAGHTRKKEGALGQGDPRQIHEFLQEKSISSWLDIEQTGRTGLFEDIAEGMKRCKVVVACVSDEYAQSANCQMEFRFAHIALRKPVILAVVGTGFLWESTEVGMLSLGYPKVNFQVANEIAHQQLLQYIRERLQQVGDPSSTVDRPLNVEESEQKHNAFKELYELAQRKFLRQITSFVNASDQYPRLFVADLNYDPANISRQQSESDGDNDLEMTLQDGSTPTFVVSELKTGQFCMKTLCEYEGGWHCVDTEGIPIELSGSDLVCLWEMAAPYMSRMLAILKHSDINLHVVSSEPGHKMMKLLEQKAGTNSELDLRPLYLELRRFMKAKDVTGEKGKLARCYMASGKVLWLCKEHQKLARVTVLKDTDPDTKEAIQDEAMESDTVEDTVQEVIKSKVEQPEEASQSEQPEVMLLRALRELTDDNSDNNKQDAGLETPADNREEVSLIRKTGGKEEKMAAKTPTTKPVSPKPVDNKKVLIENNNNAKEHKGGLSQAKGSAEGESRAPLSAEEKQKIIKRTSGLNMAAVNTDIKASKACIIL